MSKPFGIKDVPLSEPKLGICTECGHTVEVSYSPSGVPDRDEAYDYIVEPHNGCLGAGLCPKEKSVH